MDMFYHVLIFTLNAIGLFILILLYFHFDSGQPKLSGTADDGGSDDEDDDDVFIMANGFIYCKRR